MVEFFRQNPSPSGRLPPIAEQTKQTPHRRILAEKDAFPDAMSYRIIVAPSGHCFQASAETSLLQSALDAGINLPYGCRDGACGCCKGRIVAGQVDRGGYQPHALSDQEAANGHALFCCTRPLSDLTIECREVGAVRDIPVKTLPCRVQRMERAAPDVIVLHLKLPANERLQFLAGQYIDILLKDGRRRGFSLANAPHDDEHLQLHVRLVPGGRLTEHVFNAMKERDILRFDGPHGTFFLREESTKPIILVAGGTGFAPIKAIIEHALHLETARPMTLYWGARERAGLYLGALAAAWAARKPGLRYIPVLSQPRPEDGWRGRTGLVHEAIMADQPDLSACQVYACGAPAMIDAARRDFIGRCGLPEEEFFSDSFTFSADTLAA
jgi:CDP-4-dehydro-6-deoxyglucose reductase